MRLRGSVPRSSETSDLPMRMQTFAGFVLATWLIGSASAEPSTSLEWCIGKGAYPADKRIAECTAVIESGRESKKDRAKAHFVRGGHREQAKDYDAAFREYDEAIKLDPEFARALNRRAGIYWIRRDADRAIQDYSTVIRLNPNDVGALYGRGLAYADQKDADRAIRDFDEAARLGGKHHLLFYFRGREYLRKHDLDAAIRDFDRAIELEPAHVNSLMARAISHIDKGDTDRGIRDYDRVIQLDARHADAVYMRGVSLLKKGEVARAGDDYLRAAELDAKYRESSKALGFVLPFLGRASMHVMAGDLGRAIADYDAGLRLDPKCAACLYGRGLAKLKKGDEAGGKADLALATVIKPDVAEQFEQLGRR